MSDILYGKLAIEVYYLEENNNGLNEFYLTTNIEKVDAYDQNNPRFLIDNEIIKENDYKKIKIFSDRLFEKYKYINNYLLENYDVYHKATRFFLFRDHFVELYNAFGEKEKLYKHIKHKPFLRHSKLCNRIIKIPCCVDIRFKFHIAGKYLLGAFLHFFYLLFFFKDIIANLYENYFNYRAAIHGLKRLEKELEYKPKNDMQESYNNKWRNERKQFIEEKKAIYAKSNMAFFTLFLAVIIFVVTVIIHSGNMNKKENEITVLKNKNERLEKEILEIKGNYERENYINQSQINNDY